MEIAAHRYLDEDVDLVYGGWFATPTRNRQKGCGRHVAIQCTIGVRLCRASALIECALAWTSRAGLAGTAIMTSVAGASTRWNKPNLHRNFLWGCRWPRSHWHRWTRGRAHRDHWTRWTTGAHRPFWCLVVQAQCAHVGMRRNQVSRQWNKRKSYCLWVRSISFGMECIK